MIVSRHDFGTTARNRVGNQVLAAGFSPEKHTERLPALYRSLVA